eukprot:12909470-Prorocentrum_lima.AAC.1
MWSGSKNGCRPGLNATSVPLSAGDKEMLMKVLFFVDRFGLTRRVDTTRQIPSMSRSSCA